MSSDNELMIKISADVAEMKKGMDEALKALDSVAKGAASTATMTGLATVAFQEMANILKQAASAVYSYVSAQWDVIDVLGDTSVALGIATADLQRFQYAATLSGSSAEGATALLRGMQMALANAGNDGEESAQKFNQLGLSVKELKDLQPAEAAAKLADAVAQVKGSAEQTGAAMDVFGRGARENLAFIKQGGENMRSLAEEAKGLGIGLRDIDIKAVKDAQDGIDGLKIRMSSVAMAINVEVAPAITAIVTELGKSLRAAEQNKQAFSGIADDVVMVADQVNNLFNSIQVFSAAFKTAVMAVATSVYAVLESVAATAFKITAAFADGLALVLEKFGKVADAEKLRADAAKLANYNWALTTTAAEQTKKYAEETADALKKWSSEGHRFRDALKQARAEAGGGGGGGGEAPFTGHYPATSGKIESIPTGETDDAARLKVDKEIADMRFAQQVSDLEALKALHAQYSDQKMKDDLGQYAYETEMENRKYAEAQQRLQSAYADKDALDADRMAAELQAKQDHEDALTRIQEQSLNARLSLTASALGDLSSLMNTKSKEAFEIGKIAAIAQTTILTYQSAQQAFTAWTGAAAFSANPGLIAAGLASAGAAIVAGGVRVASIASTQFGGGGPRGGGGGGYTGGEGGNSAAAAPAPRQTNVNISLQGSSFSDVQVRGLIASIGEAMGDNVKLGVA